MSARGAGSTLGVWTFLLLVAVSGVALNIPVAKASGTIYIRADGTIDPSTAPIQRVGDSYKFTGNIFESIVVERDNIVIDGSGYTVQHTGTGFGNGISLSSRKNITIKNAKIKGFYYGVIGGSSSTISGNLLTDNVCALGLGSNNNITGNTIRVSTGTFIEGTGIWLLDGSSNSTISRNNIIQNNMGNGIELFSGSKNNTIIGNTIKSCGDGISFFEATNNTVSENIITNHNNGISFQSCSRNTISRNCITNNTIGIELYGPSNSNTISGNIIANNSAGTYGGGISLHGSYNTISGNNITNNYCGIRPHWAYTWASNNSICHNNFVNNNDQVNFEDLLSIWDEGYPSGGNYWSDYIGVDEFRGPHQNETSSDGIGDTPYVIDENNADHYPLMLPWPVSAPLIPTTPPHVPTEVQVGVEAGDWVKCTYTISGWPSGTPYPEWLKLEFLSIEGTTATVRVTMRMSNGTELSETVPVDIAAGGQALGLSGFVIPANCTTGNSICIGGYGDVTIAGETSRIYAGTSRTVVYASFSQLGTQLTYYWDKLTGVMVEASTTSGSVTGTGKATETNMWATLPETVDEPETVDGEIPLWMQWWFYALVAAIVIVLAAGIYFVKRKPAAVSSPPLG